MNPNFTTCAVYGTWGYGRMTCYITDLIVEKGILEFTLVCNNYKAQASCLPPYPHTSEWATGFHIIAVNTADDEPASAEEGFPLQTAAGETSAIRKLTSNRGEPASMLYQRAANIEERSKTLAGTKTVCIFCTTGGQHRSHRCAWKTTIGNNIKVANQQALDSITEKLGFQRK